MFMKMTKLAGVAAVGLVLAVPFALTADARGGAGGKVMHGGGMMDRLDTDGDGRVSRAEYDTHFDTLDTDHDGYVTREEVQGVRTQRRTERRAERFAADDTDGDGMVTRDEFSGPSKHFAKIDTNGDGSITEEELQGFQPVRDRMGRRPSKCTDD